MIKFQNLFKTFKVTVVNWALTSLSIKVNLKYAYRLFNCVFLLEINL